MKVWGKNIGRLEDKNFELYLVEDIGIDDEFSQVLYGDENANLKSHVYTDGQIVIISDKTDPEDSAREVRYKLLLANWIVKCNEDLLQVYVKGNYLDQIRTRNSKIDSFLSKYYNRCRNIIIDKKKFAKEMGKLACDFNLPFELVLSFKGDKKALEEFVKTVENAIRSCFYADSQRMRNLVDRDSAVRCKTFEYMGLYVPEEYMLKSYQIGEYVYKCLLQRKILGNLNY